MRTRSFEGNPLDVNISMQINFDTDVLFLRLIDTDVLACRIFGKENYYFKPNKAFFAH